MQAEELKSTPLTQMAPTAVEHQIVKNLPQEAAFDVTKLVTSLCDDARRQHKGTVYAPEYHERADSPNKLMCQVYFTEGNRAVFRVPTVVISDVGEVVRQSLLQALYEKVVAEYNRTNQGAELTVKECAFVGAVGVRSTLQVLAEKVNAAWSATTSAASSLVSKFWSSPAGDDVVEERSDSDYERMQKPGHIVMYVKSFNDEKALLVDPKDPVHGGPQSIANDTECGALTIAMVFNALCLLQRDTTATNEVVRGKTYKAVNGQLGTHTVEHVGRFLAEHTPKGGRKLVA